MAEQNQMGAIRVRISGKYAKQTNFACFVHFVVMLMILMFAAPHIADGIFYCFTVADLD